ncbi:MAG TPA: ATP-binding protein [Pseudomonadaceae bacterium]|nr:ATP-binding protein [Pseudomonadaceae bacterium]
MNKATTILEFQFAAKPEQLGHVREKLREVLSPLCTSEAVMNCVILAVGEACMNIIQHAYGEQEGGDILLEIMRKGDSYTFRLTDFASRKTRLEDMQSRPLDELRPGGLGCHLINEIMDEVVVLDCKPDCGNVLQMKKCLKEEG